MTHRAALFVCFLFTALIAMPILPEQQTAVPSAPGEDSRSRPSDAQVLHGESLRLDDSISLGREDLGLLLSAPDDNPLLRFVELDGVALVLRITPLDREGRELGSGRVIVVAANERRQIGTRTDFARDAVADAVRLRVEAIEGSGRVRVNAASESETDSILQPIAGTATSRRLRPARQAPPGPTSFALIDAGEASGAITRDTAILYRVYALFADARLPSQFRGADASVEGSQYLTEAREQFGTLSPSVQASLLPFFTPPAYTTSWTNASSVSQPSTRADDPGPVPTCTFFSEQWAFVDSTNGLFRVWYRVAVPDDFRNAGSLAGQIDATIWPKLSGLMINYPPLPDLAEACNGGNGRLDIYLVDSTRSYTVTFGAACKQVPVFILLKRNSGPALAVHEIFHAIEYSLPMRSCISKPDYRWWAEASAHWAQDFVYPQDQREQTAAPNFLGNPEETLDLINDKHEYGAYLLPFYVHRKTGSADFVRVAWEGCASQSAINALDQALSGGFDKVWPEFVRFNWNQKPVDDYTTWDSMRTGAAPTEVEVRLSGAGDGGSEIQYQLPRLSATYTHYKFTDPAVRFITFWNGATFNLTLEEKTALGVQYEPAAGTADQKKGARVQALIKLRLQSQWQVADWTNLPFVTFCRDMLAERVDEIVVIISNSDLDASRKMQAASLSPVMWASNMGCWRWKGTAEYNDPAGGARIATNVTWTRPEASQGPPFVAYKAEGSLSWSFSGACTGGGTKAIVPEYAFLSGYNYTPSAGKFHRAYTIAGADPTLVTVSCNGTPAQTTVGYWVSAPPAPLVEGVPLARFLKVSANGTVMDDTFSFPGTTAVWKWHLEAESQP